MSTVKPNSTVASSATLADANGVPVTSTSTVTVTVTFPDATSETPPVTYAGSGVYIISYASKGPGVIAEVWYVTGFDGSVVTSKNFIPVSY